MRGAFALFGIGLMLIFGCAGAPPDQNQTNQSCACTKEYVPVCGIDGKTYGNECTAKCANVSIDYRGECTTCNDTDGGKDTSVKGTASAAGMSYMDVCYGFGAVDEYFCDGKIVNKETVPCQGGFECVGGACVKAMPKPPMECFDTDGGKNTTHSGTVTSGGAEYQDSCQDNKNVKEFYCKVDGSSDSEAIPCKTGFGCEGGRCVKLGQTCVDSDGGRNTDIGGEVEVKIGLVIAEHLDKCLSDTRLREYYCLNNEQIVEDIECAKDSRCVTAACKEDQCFDSDGGYAIFSKGAVNKGSELYDDHCDNLSSGVEYYCDDNKVTSSTFTCKSGFSCRDGRCEGS